MTSSETVVVSEVVPLVPFIVMVCVPSAALLLTVILIVEVPAPVIELGLKLMVTPLGCPVADNEMAESKPPVTVVVTVVPLELLRATVSEDGDALREKPALILVTVSETVVVSVVLPEVPVTVMLYVPVAVEEATVMVIVELPVPVIEVGLKVTVTPVGWPEADKVTAELNPPDTVLEMVEVPALPSTTVTEAGEAERLKPGVADEPASALIRPDPFGLPHPVAKS